MRYALRLRPVASWTLPVGVKYDLVALPKDHNGMVRPDLPVSRNYQFGEFTTNRPLTRDEIEHFDVIEIPEEN